MLFWLSLALTERSEVRVRCTIVSPELAGIHGLTADNGAQ